MVQRKVIVRGATNQALDELDAADIPDLSAAYEAAGGIATHAADTTSVHGITDSTVLATDAEVATAVGDHSADTTAVHGIADTAALSLTSHDHDADYEAAGGIATHAAAADPHAGYLKESDFDDIDFLVGTATGHTAAEIAVGTTPGGELGGTWAAPTVDATHSGSTHGAAVTTHEGAADPHTAYQKESEKSAASGYASLDAGTKVPIAELPTGTTGTTVALGNAAAGLITTHEAAGNPHPTYETAAEVLAQIGTHEGLANPHPGYLTPAEGDAAYQPLDSDLTAIAALATTAFGRGLLALADAAALGAAHSHSGATTTYAPGSFTVATGNYSIMSELLELTTTQVATIEGTAVLRIT